MTAPRETGGEGRYFAQSFDARDWAQAFVGYVRINPAIASDEATMHGWFANAIMRGFDEANRRALATPRPVEVTEGAVLAEAAEVALIDLVGAAESGALADSPGTFAGEYIRSRRGVILTALAALRAQPAGGTPVCMDHNAPHIGCTACQAWLDSLESAPVAVADAGGTRDAQDDAWVVPALKREIDDLRDVLAECFVAVGVAITDDHGLDAGEGERVQGLVRAVMGLDHPKIVAWLALPEDGAPVADAGGTP